MSDPGLVLDLFVWMLLSSVLSFGGGNGQIPIIQSRWVEPGLLAPGLFSFALAVSYLTPGPRSGFIAAVGYYLAGLPGAAAAVLGLVVPTCLGAGAVSLALRRVEKLVALIEPATGFVIAALIAAAAWGTAAPMDLRPTEVLAVGAVALLVAWRNVEPLLVVGGAAAVGVVWSLVA